MLGLKAKSLRESRFSLVELVLVELVLGVGCGSAGELVTAVVGVVTGPSSQLLPGRFRAYCEISALRAAACCSVRPVWLPKGL